ncbi:MAG: hypothetical protein GY796_06815, partial [Chloroflexi bacterium]|nr:hypothetical protein [Chloroflexota bacterium]
MSNKPITPAPSTPLNNKPNTHPKVILWLVRLLAWGLALFFIVWAITGNPFRDSEGFWQGLFILPLAVGLALFLLGWAMGTVWQPFAGWLSLALVAQAAALQLIDAGSRLHYQHYRPLDTYPALLIVIGLQTILVLIGLSQRWRSIWGWLIAHFKMWQLLLIAG